MEASYVVDWKPLYVVCGKRGGKLNLSGAVAGIKAKASPDPNPDRFAFSDPSSHCWADMDEFLAKASFDKATIFESGYGFGFRQFEVRNLRFLVVPITGGGEYDAAACVERGKRKQKIIQLNHVLIVEGWDHPALELSTVETSNRGTVHHAKFTAFSPGWDGLLDEYLATRASRAKVIIDGRNRADLAPRSGPARPVARQTPTRNISGRDSGDRGSTQAFSEGSVDSFLLDRFERDSQAREACLKHFGYRCRACQTLLSDLYGPLGDRYIHVHHRVPLSEIREEYRVDPTRDLIPVCPNCHSMLHRSSPPMSIEELADIVRRVAADGVAAGTSCRIETPTRRRPCR